MTKYLLIFLILVSCSANKEISQKNFQNLDLWDNLSFEEFKEKLEEYSKKQSYPNIDN
tara:strand:+ start:230 stop:403 length:174 start_codon:yes stop_codon:yes gene_type:complete